MSLLFIVMSYARRHQGDRKSRYLSQVRSEMSADCKSLPLGLGGTIFSGRVSVIAENTCRFR